MAEKENSGHVDCVPFVPTIIVIKSTAKLQEEIEEELKVDDPDPESAQAQEIFKAKEDKTT